MEVCSIAAEHGQPLRDTLLTFPMKGVTGHLVFVAGLSHAILAVDIRSGEVSSTGLGLTGIVTGLDGIEAVTKSIHGECEGEKG